MGDGEHLGHHEGDDKEGKPVDDLTDPILQVEDDDKGAGDGICGDSKPNSPLIGPDEKAPVAMPASKYPVWPYTWWVIAAIWVLFFIISLGVNNCPRQTDRLQECELRWLGVFSFNPIRQNPLCGPGSRALVSLGALDARKTSRQNQEWRVLTCLLLHAGLIHLLVNVPTTMFVGTRLEREYGTARMLVVFFISALGGALWSALLLVPNNISVGASFPLFGLIGCTIADMSINGGLYINKAVASVVLFVVGFIHIVFGLMPYVDNWGQIGAFLTGFILALLVLIKPRCKFEKNEPAAVKCGIDLRTKMKLQPWEEVVRVSALLALGAGFVFMIVALFSGADWKKDCKWCRHLNCAEAPGWDCPRYQRLQPENTYKKLTCFVREVEETGFGTLVCPDGRMVDIGPVKARTRATLQLVCEKACRAW